MANNKADHFKYKAFISYSHAADGLLAPSLQAALQKFAKPFYKLRAVQVFRDQTDLSANPSLWSVIQNALDKSEFFFLLASPKSAGSKWVNREVEYWLEVKGGKFDKLFVILTEGELIWDGSIENFDLNKTTSLPDKLKDRFKDEPLYLDFRWARTTEDLSLRNPQFLDSIATLAAPLHGKSKSDLIGEDVRSYRIFKMIVATVFLLLVLTIVAGGAAFYTNRLRRKAEIERQQAEIQRQQAEIQGQRAEMQRREEEEQRRIAQEVAERTRDQSNYYNYRIARLKEQCRRQGVRCDD
jgi:TIR domain-containing protein